MTSASALYAADGGGGLYIGDLGQAVASLIAFVILLLLLKKYAWKPILEQLDKREKDIQARLKDAHKKQADAEDLHEEYAQRISEAKVEAEQIRNDIRRQAEQEKQDIITAAQSQAHHLLQRAQQDIDAAKTDAHRQLENETARLVAEIAQNVLGRNLSADEHQRLIDQASEHISDQLGDRT